MISGLCFTPGCLTPNDLPFFPGVLKVSLILLRTSASTRNVAAAPLAKRAAGGESENARLSFHPTFPRWTGAERASALQLDDGDEGDDAMPASRRRIGGETFAILRRFYPEEKSLATSISNVQEKISDGT